ncbi:hypothetical protein [Nitratireductor sp. ZSWI3]|uniref:hypothetical protein n=1 Tax=Nitratireductor sp. ZSWI3 TaxID=2966359 RepID=UPI00214FFCF2|nr:hypothetical protein [Nitratireductor sp. ZSWI3]MCR4264662.1 hypothetical protein [Nitratireductor sp. ZSWI3]
MQDRRRHQNRKHKRHAVATTPTNESAAPPKPIADAGDVGGGSAQPYEVEVQEDAVARQTLRKREPHGIDKPAKQ